MLLAEANYEEQEARHEIDMERAELQIDQLERRIRMVEEQAAQQTMQQGEYVQGLVDFREQQRSKARSDVAKFRESLKEAEAPKENDQ